MEELLNYLDSIYPLTEGLWVYLSKTIKQKEIPKKYLLLKAGHICHSIYFIKAGMLRCYYMKQATEVCSWFMKEGDVVISVESFFNQRPSKEYIQALEDTELLYIDFSELQFIYKNFLEFNFVSRVLIERYYTLSEQRLYSLRMQRAGERYEYLVSNYPELIQRVPSKYLASYLGMTEVWLSKIRAK